MSFSFRGTTPAFGATPAKPAFSGFAFGNTAPTSTTTSTGFGGFGSSFSTPATTAPAFGGGFGTPATSAPAFGSSFGAPSTLSTTGFGAPATTGFGFGTPATSAPAFGTSSATTGFGSSFGLSTSTAPTFRPNFGGTTTTPSTGFSGFGGFGAAATTTTMPSLFSGFGTAAAPTTASFSGFGGGTSLSSTGFGSFGSTPATSTGFAGFGAGFGAKPATSTGFAGFGSSLTGLGQPQQAAQPAQQPVDPNQAIYNSIFNCNVFGDERDTILAKWNLLQASWGTGKGYYSQSQPPVEYTLQNPYCRFKAVGYSLIPGYDNKDGITAMIVNKKESELKPQKEQLISNLNAFMGNKPNLSITIENIRSISEAKSQVLFYVQEKGMTGSIRKIPATDLVNYLLQPMQKQQMASLGIENVFPHTLLDSDQLKEYLAKPPGGVDVRIWKQAQLDNPDPSKYIPISLIGFEQLKWRSKCQEKETVMHRGFLEQVSQDIVELKRRHAASIAQIAEQKRKLIELQHRVLQILVRQEVTRKVGMALQPEEEVLKGQLENMQCQLNIPTHFKGRINELMAEIRLQNSNGEAQLSTERYNIDGNVQEDIKQFLKMEQTGISHLVGIINADLSHLKIIRDGMQELLQKH